MLILTISLFLATEIPLFVITALHTFSNNVHSFMDYDIGKNVILVINLLICLLDPVKLGIYCSMSRLENSQRIKLHFYKILFFAGVSGKPSCPLSITYL